MSNNSTLDDQLRSVEQRAIRASTESADGADQALFEASLSAEETIELINSRYQREGVQVDALSATGRPGAIKIRSEVTMSQRAAENLFGQSTSPRQKQNQAETLHLQQFRNRIVHANATDGSASQFIRELVEGFATRAHFSTLPDWMHAILNLDRDDKSDAALDDLFDCVDPILSAREFGRLDGIIAAMPVEGPSLTLMMGILSITRPAKEHLPSRARFFERVYRLCKAMRRDAESLLGGLR